MRKLKHREVNLVGLEESSQQKSHHSISTGLASSSKDLNVITLKPGVSWFREQFSPLQSHKNECKKESPGWFCVIFNLVPSHVKGKYRYLPTLVFLGGNIANILICTSGTSNAMLSSVFHPYFYTMILYPLLCTLCVSVLFELVIRNIHILHWW